MDYSTLNRLKDKMEHATSAYQVANIASEIENEEQRIRENEEKENAVVESLIAQKNILQNNNDTLKKMYEDSQKELKKSQRINWIMLIIALVSMLATVGTFIFSLIR